MEEKEVKLLREILEGFVNNPDAIKIERNTDEMGVMLLIEAAKEDLGLVIGKQGETINAIRTIMRCVGLKNRARISVKINEPDRPSREDSHGDSFGGF